jgi:hypothetical protein
MDQRATFQAIYPISPRLGTVCLTVHADNPVPMRLALGVRLCTANQAQFGSIKMGFFAGTLKLRFR